MWPKRGLFQGREWRNFADSPVRRPRNPEVPSQSPPLFFLRFSAPHLANRFAYCHLGNIFVLYIVMNVFHCDLQENDFLTLLHFNYYYVICYYRFIRFAAFGQCSHVIIS